MDQNAYEQYYHQDIRQFEDGSEGTLPDSSYIPQRPQHPDTRPYTYSDISSPVPQSQRTYIQPNGTHISCSDLSLMMKVSTLIYYFPLKSAVFLRTPHPLHLHNLHNMNAGRILVTHTASNSSLSLYFVSLHENIPRRGCIAYFNQRICIAVSSSSVSSMLCNLNVMTQ